MKTRLIIVEGIPGTGKTTTAQTIREICQLNGVKPLLYLENAHYHPVDVDNLSFLNEHQYNRLLTEYSQYKSRIREMTEKGKNGYFIHYLRWFDLYDDPIPEVLLEGLMNYDVHDTLPPEDYLALLKERWQSFAFDQKMKDEVVILECCLFQNPFTVFTGKHNYDFSAVQTIIRDLAECVHDLNPMLIYLYGDDARVTLKRVIETRPQQWIDLVISYITGQGYGKARNLQGLEGVMAFYHLLHKHMEELVSDLEWNKLSVNIDNQKWEQKHQIIADFLGCS